jgi:hypothetical protein
VNVERKREKEKPLLATSPFNDAHGKLLEGEGDGARQKAACQDGGRRTLNCKCLAKDEGMEKRGWRVERRDKTTEFRANHPPPIFHLKSDLCE